jgi:oligopeptidase A
MYSMNIAHHDNPLLDLSGPPRFDEIQPRHVEPAVEAMLARNREQLERLLAANTVYTWENFAQPMEDMDEELDRMWSPVAHLNAVRDSDAMREAYNNCLPQLTDYSTAISQDERVYRAYRQIADSDEYRDLSRSQRKIIDNTLRDFRLSGAELGPREKARFRAIRQELSTLTSRFDQNLLDATHAWDLRLAEPADLSGLPDSAVAMARQAATDAGCKGWRFTLDAPSYLAFMTFADNRELRRRMYEAYVCRASDQGPHAGQHDNTELMQQMLRLRRELAGLLGYDNYSEYSLATKMARNTEEVTSFLRDLAARSKPVAERDYAELVAFARESGAVGSIEPWDIMYYSEKQRERLYRFSQEEVRAYFPAPTVIDGMFEVIRRLYGMSVSEVDDVPVWHPDVRFYEIRDGSDNVRGRFYLDLYARPHKRGGAWMDECVTRKRTEAGAQVPVAYLTCNFSPPLEQRPSLLTHDEVITLFHEFGHGLHHMLTQVDYVGVSGINGVEWDAVELPSQFMENWCWEPEALRFLSRHVDSGEPLPEELLEKMRAAKNFHSGMHMVRQLEFSLFDMRLYSSYDPDGPRTLQQLLDEVRAEVAVILPPPFNRFQNGFSHIFSGGYAAGYYSYKWAEVLSADAFSKFEERGVFDRATGLEFLHNVLEQGGSREALDLFVAFRGREPRPDALLRHSGLAA